MILSISFYDASLVCEDEWRFIVSWCNGSTLDFDSNSHGPNPCETTIVYSGILAEPKIYS